MGCPATPATAKFAIFGECLAGHLSDTALCSIDYVSVRPIRGAIHGPRCSGDVKVEAIPLADTLAAIRTQLWPILDTEGVDIASARGRVLATDLVAKVNLPHWDSAAVDGFAVRGPDLVPDRINRLIDSDRRARSRPPVCWRPRPWTSRWNPHWRSTSGWCRGNRCGHAPARAGRRTSWCPGLQSAAGAPATFRARAQLRHDL